VLRVSISGPASLYIGAKDPTELIQCIIKHKRRNVNYHAEIPVVIVVTQTTESYVVQSAEGKKDTREIDVNFGMP
jgi:hypothetical protein